jgi:energy-coupling factor transport system permease protein
MRAGAGFGYRPLGSPLHAARPWIAALWASALMAAGLLLVQPILLGTLLLAVLAAGVGAGVGAQLARSLRLVAIVAVPIVLVNVLVSRDGLTVFARVGDLGPFGQGDLTVEAAVYGAWIALKVALVMLVTTLASLTIDPDELMRAFRGLSFRSALTASLGLRMIPLLGADAARLAEAQRTRPDARTGVRGRALLVGAVVAGSLDRAMDVAATLEVRGFAAGPPGARGWRRLGFSMRERARRARMWRGRRDRYTASGAPPFSRHDFAFAASALAVLAITLAARLLGADSFSAYPLVHDPVSAWTLLACLALAAAVTLPFCDRRGIER